MCLALVVGACIYLWYEVYTAPLSIRIQEKVGTRPGQVRQQRSHLDQEMNVLMQTLASRGAYSILIRSLADPSQMSNLQHIAAFQYLQLSLSFLINKTLAYFSLSKTFPYCLFECCKTFMSINDVTGNCHQCVYHTNLPSEILMLQMQPSKC